MSEFYVSFGVMGHIKQRVEIADAAITAEKLQDMLSKGEAVTSVQEDGHLVLTSDFETVIGNVIEVDNFCEYSDFEVKPN